MNVWTCKRSNPTPDDPTIFVHADRAFDARYVAALELGEAPMNVVAKDAYAGEVAASYDARTVVYAVSWAGNAASNTLHRAVREVHRGADVKRRESCADAPEASASLLGHSYDVRVGDLRRVTKDLPDDMPVRLEVRVDVGGVVKEIKEDSVDRDAMLCRMDVESIGDHDELVLFGVEEEVES